MVAYTYNPSTWEASGGGLQVQDHPELYSKFQACLDYIVRPCLKNSHVCHQLVLLANFYAFFHFIHTQSGLWHIFLSCIRNGQL